MDQYSELSKKMTKSLSKKEKKEQGIFITPRSIIKKLFETIDMTNITSILEPSCGTCEIIDHCIKYDIPIVGVEKNDKIFHEISKLDLKFVTLIHGDFLQINFDEQFDLIVGNPPYVVIKKELVPSKYEKYFCGRPNMFGIFILKSLELLKENGILAFIIPTSFLNSAYYKLIRKHIYETCSILSINNYEMNDFVDTEQGTISLIIQKCLPTCFNYSLDLGTIIFTDKLDKLKELFVGSTTLKKMGLLVRTGQIVWNQHKDKLCNEGTLLIYNSNLYENTIITKDFKNDEKKQYITTKGRTGNTMVVNRGNGNSAYVLKYAIVTNTNTNCPYLIENHLNEIYSKTHVDISVYESIKNSFDNPKTQEFIKIYLGNNGLSKTELETIFPIYL
jgi:adenine-specific DNA-methyltransferase